MVSEKQIISDLLDVLVKNGIITSKHKDYKRIAYTFLVKINERTKRNERDSSIRNEYRDMLKAGVPGLQAREFLAEKYFISSKSIKNLEVVLYRKKKYKKRSEKEE